MGMFCTSERDVDRDKIVESWVFNILVNPQLTEDEKIRALENEFESQSTLGFFKLDEKKQLIEKHYAFVVWI